MAKQVKKFDFSKVGDLLDKISEKIPIHIDKEERTKTYINTGSLILNAALSGSLFGGIGDRGIYTFAGPEASGKTFLALNIMREAQKMGYGVVYIDTEYAINRSDLPKYGIDNSPEKFIIVRGNQVEELNMAVTQLIDSLKEAKLEGYEMPKQIWALDSLAQMSSKKMKDDLLKGDSKTDMTKAKAISALFVSITADINFLDIPLVVNNQTYETMDLFSQTEMKGGRQLKYSSNIITYLTRAKLKDNVDDMDLGQSGIIVTAKCIKNRTAKPKQVKFEISFEKGMNLYKGLDVFCRPEYFDQIGIAQGKWETYPKPIEKLDKSTGELTYVDGAFKAGGNRWYCKHLGTYVNKADLFTSKVFTQDVLERMEPIINNYFKYKSLDEIEEFQKEFEHLEKEEDDELDNFSDTMDSDDLFN